MHGNNYSNSSMEILHKWIIYAPVAMPTAVRRKDGR